MLENLKKRALQENINNIKLVNRDWNRVDIDNDIEQHDVVLVSRSLPGAQLSETLRKFDRSAARACYLTWRAERSDEYEITVAEALGKRQHEYPDFHIISEALSYIGFPVNTEIFEAINEEKFPTLDVAVFNMSRGVELSYNQRQNLLNYAKNRLSFKNGYYCSLYKMKWALISWRK